MPINPIAALEMGIPQKLQEIIMEMEMAGYALLVAILIGFVVVIFDFAPAVIGIASIISRSLDWLNVSLFMIIAFVFMVVIACLAAAPPLAGAALVAIIAFKIDRSLRK